MQHSLLPGLIHIRVCIEMGEDYFRRPDPEDDFCHADVQDGRFQALKIFRSPQLKRVEVVLPRKAELLRIKGVQVLTSAQVEAWAERITKMLLEHDD